jgi:hypothetical protein
MSDASRETPMVTAGLDLGDKYSYLWLLNIQSGEVLEEGRVRTTPEAFRQRFDSEQQLRIAIELGTHSPWVSRLLEELGHEDLVANPRKIRLIYARASARVTNWMPKTSLGWLEWMRSCCTRSSTGVRTPRLIWPSSARARHWSVRARS